MSREVMGSAAEDPVTSGADRLPADAADPPSDLLLVQAHGVGDDLRPAAGPSREAIRRRVAAVVVGSAVVAGLLGAGVTAAVLQGGNERPRVVAWLEFSDGADYPGNDRVSMVLNVVNAGQGEMVIDGVDFDGGPEPGARAPVVSVALDQSVPVAPGAHAKEEVLVRVDDCESTTRPVDDAGGTLRVSVTGADTRRSWVVGSEVGAFPVTSSTLVELVCHAGAPGPVETGDTSVSADGELVMTLRSTGQDAQVFEVRGPEGVRFTGEPTLPITVPGRDAGTIQVAIRLFVDDCTDEVRQLEAANQMRLVVDEQDVYDYDFMLVHAWYVREVTRACG